MKSRGVVSLVVVALLAGFVAPAVALESDRSIVRTKSGLDGLKVVNSVCALRGCTVLGSLDTVPGQTQPSSLFLVRGLVDHTVTTLLSLLGLAAIEPDLPVGIVLSFESNQASAAVLDQLWDREPMTYYGSLAWRGYLRQPANDIIRLRETHCSLGTTGGGIVAVIDTGVDSDHPTLKPVLVPGYDFTRNIAGSDEKNDLGQASAAVLDGVYDVNGNHAVVDQASAAVLDDPKHAAFGHGTMVAGVIHLASPSAKIMPLKAFGSDGQGYTSSIVRAIYYATFNGAKVLNMSFSRTTSSLEMKIALDLATSRGLIAVASAGNNGTSALVYPAAYDNVMGIASTSNDDVRSSFSNYGSSLVWVAAPGEGIITTYPFSSFAAASGTSFSTPYVAGTAALIAGMQSSANENQAASLVANAKPLTSDLGYGRLDAYQAVAAGRVLWPHAATSEPPDSCQDTGVDWSETP